MVEIPLLTTTNSKFLLVRWPPTLVSLGFALIGNDIRTCTGDGSSTTGAFSGIDPTCERK